MFISTYKIYLWLEFGQKQALKKLGGPVSKKPTL